MNKLDEIFIFYISDGGIVKKTITNHNLNRLIDDAEVSTSIYLAEHGTRMEGEEELRTDDGYASILSSIPGDPASEKVLLSYDFDGEIKVADVMQKCRHDLI